MFTGTCFKKKKERKIFLLSMSETEFGLNKKFYIDINTFEIFYLDRRHVNQSQVKKELTLLHRFYKFVTMIVPNLVCN